VNGKLRPVLTFVVLLSCWHLYGQESVRLDPVDSLPCYPSGQTASLLKKLKIPAPGLVPVRSLEPLMERIMGFYENSGYPFINVQLDTVRFADSILQGRLVIRPGDRIRMDSVLNRTGYRISNRQLERITGIRSGDVYNEAAIREAASRLAAVQWLTLKRPTEVGFHDRLASLFVYPAKAPANRFDGWIGLSAGKAGSGAVSLSGALNLELMNIAGQGESWKFNWKRNQDRSQHLDLSLNLPWLAGLPVGLKGYFDLYRQDTSYLNILWEIGVPYSFSVNHHVNLFYRYQASTILTDLPAAAAAGRQPYSVWLTGLAWGWDRLDNPVNPSKGFSLLAEASTGRKTIVDSIGLRQSELAADLKWFQPLAGKMVIALRAEAGYRQTPKRLDNETYRLGGVDMLRGFYEDTYRTNRFIAGSVELRYLMNQSSHILFLVDLGYLEQGAESDVPATLPYGFGLGGQVRTAGGIFRIIFALGQEWGQNPDLSAGKIHIGYVGLF